MHASVYPMAPARLRRGTRSLTCSPPRSILSRGAPVTARAPKIYGNPSALLAVGGGLAIVAGAVGGVFLTASETGPSDSPIGTTLMLSSLGLSLATSVTWQIWSEAVAPADAQLGYATRVWIAGQSPGEPSGAKVGVVSALHAASLAALGLGIWRYVEYRDARQDFDRAGRSRLCPIDTPESAACAEWRSQGDQAEGERKASFALLTGAGLLHVIGLAVAEWWPNVTPIAGANRRGVQLQGRY